MPQSPQVKLLTVAHRNTSQYTLRNHHRRALPPHPSEDGLGPSGLPRPGSSGLLLATDREELVPDPGGTEDSSECTRRSDRALPAARRCLCPSPRNWNSTTAARSWNHVLSLPPLPLPPPPAPRHAAPEQTMTGRASRDSAFRTSLRRMLRPPQLPQPPLCLRKRTQRESPRSLPTALQPRPPPHLWPITELEVFPPPP
uniref:formin-like protein 14 n=1 Tax=Arvicanthis niloticus TaxID=61156 RepID=UPI0014860EF1|nr:formin-like protein 14 [Arvicanthis niloticus]